MRSSRRSSLADVSDLLGGRRGYVITLVVASFLGGICEAAILATIAQVAAALVNGSRHVQVVLGPLTTTATVGSLLTFALGLAVARLLLQGPLSVLPARIAADVQAHLQRDLFGAYTHASWTEQAHDREGDLQELMTNQVLQAAVGALSATALVTAMLSLAVLLASAFLLDPVAALAVTSAAVILLGLLRPLNKLTSRRSRALSQTQMDLASTIGQAARLAEETHVFGVSDPQFQHVEGSVGAVQRLFFLTQTLARLGPSVYQSAIYLLVVGGLALISGLHSGHVAALGAIVLLLVRAGSYGQQVQGSYQNVVQALPFVERVRQVQERYAASTPVTGDRRLTSVDTVAFRNVSYAYQPGRPALSDISFDVTAGETIGIIGPSGAGKSTLVQLLLQLRAADRGQIEVNSMPANVYDRADWHAAVAYVPQEPKLLHASVADNIRFLRAIADPEIERAAQLARIHADIVTWRSGYDSIIGPRADAVSGGQRQRICIARALAGRPAVLVLDEPTSALDPRSESLLHESLTSLKSGITLFIIAHRMSTLDICDRVLVVEGGRLEAFDSPERLRQRNAYYRFAAELSVGGRGSL